MMSLHLNRRSPCCLLVCCLLWHVLLQRHELLVSASDGPIPVFSDITQPTLVHTSSEAPVVTDKSAVKLKTGIVIEVFQNEAWGMGWDASGRAKVPMWSYKDGSRALPPEDIMPPEDWEWASPWQIDVSGRRETEGWEYARNWKALCALERRDGRGEARRRRRRSGGKWAFNLNVMNRYRRRRWVRAMKPKRAALELGGEEALGALRKGEVEMEVASPAMALDLHGYGYGARKGEGRATEQAGPQEGEDGEGDGGETDGGSGGGEEAPGRRRFGLHALDEQTELMVAPQLNEEQCVHVASEGPGRATISFFAMPVMPALANPWASVKAWWVEEFTFKGFGLSVVKPVFSGLLMRPDVGVGLKVPLTLHFPSYDRNERLPSISSAFMVFWPTAMQMSYSFSWPAEFLMEKYVKVCLKLLASLFFASTVPVPSIPADSLNPPPTITQTTPRRDSVQRLGWSLGMRYSQMHGLQWWIAPFFFILPGVRIISILIAKAFETVDIMHSQVRQRQQMHLSQLQQQQQQQQQEQQQQFQVRMRQHSLKQQQQDSFSPASQGTPPIPPMLSMQSMQSQQGSNHLDTILTLLTAWRMWAASKTSGLGYSLNYSGSRLGAAVILNFQPFFFNIDELLEHAAASSNALRRKSIDEDGVAEKIENGLEEPPVERLADALRSNDELLDLRIDSSGSRSTSSATSSINTNSTTDNNSISAATRSSSLIGMDVLANNSTNSTNSTNNSDHNGSGGRLTVDAAPAASPFSGLGQAAVAAVAAEPTVPADMAVAGS